MKLINTIASLFFLSLIVSACGEKGYTIQGDLVGEANGKTVYLLGSGENEEAIDSTVIENNQFQFSGEVVNPALHTIKIIKRPLNMGQSKRKNLQPVIPIFLENSVITISAVLDSIPDDLAVRTRSYSYKDITIEGSVSNDLYLSYLNQKKVFDDKRSDIFMDEYIAYLNPPQGVEKGKLSVGIEIVKRIDEAADERKNFVRDFISENKDNYIGLYAANSSIDFFTATEIDELLTDIESGGLLDTEAGIKFREKADETKISAEGSIFYDLDMEDHEGNPVNLSDYLGKGKYVLIDFWASWCGPCKADLPHLKEAYELYNPYGFEVVSVSMDEDKEAWLREIKAFELTWPQLSDLKAFDGPVSKKYAFRGIPTCILFGPDGKIVDRNMRGSWMDMILIELYGNKFGVKY